MACLPAGLGCFTFKLEAVKLLVELLAELLVDAAFVFFAFFAVVAAFAGVVSAFCASISPTFLAVAAMLFLAPGASVFLLPWSDAIEGKLGVDWRRSEDSILLAFCLSCTLLSCIVLFAD